MSNAQTPGKHLRPEAKVKSEVDLPNAALVLPRQSWNKSVEGGQDEECELDEVQKYEQAETKSQAFEAEIADRNVVSAVLYGGTKKNDGNDPRTEGQDPPKDAVLEELLDRRHRSSRGSAANPPSKPSGSFLALTAAPRITCACAEPKLAGLTEVYL